ncbi:MAG: hypothetical protein JJ920_18365 [Roseitalea sp.]|nr:hypothetical protein [Roseitalea sp.]MBO6721804.1 hypothetical protein [Roseitalea sp.]MBO6744882.1 hypothetical protein [Roseitalea sp.]
MENSSSKRSSFREAGQSRRAPIAKPLVKHSIAGRKRQLVTVALPPQLGLSLENRMITPGSMAAIAAGLVLNLNSIWRQIALAVFNLIHRTLWNALRALLRTSP